MIALKLLPLQVVPSCDIFIVVNKMRQEHDITACLTLLSVMMWIATFRLRIASLLQAMSLHIYK